MKYTKLPAITGKQLIKLFKKDGWINEGRRTHGVAMVKQIADRKLITIIPDTKASLPLGTLMAILGSKQSRLGRKGLLKLINEYGL